ncbi:MAG: endopeptidase La [Bacteroidaceae bacterium]|nr:endopeptidase La [Bacteroidaceae bacterium]
MTKQKPSFSFVAEVAGDVTKLIHASEEGHVNILAIRDNILFPGTINPIIIGRPVSMKAVQFAEKTNGLLGIFCQKDAEVDDPTYEDLMHVGVVAKVVHTMQTPDGNNNVLLQTFNTVTLKNLTKGRHGYEGDVEAVTDIPPLDSERTEYETMLALIKERVIEFGRIANNFPEEMVHFVEGMPPSTFMVNLICGNLPVDVEAKESLLLCRLELQRAQRLLVLINNIIQLARLKLNVERKTQSDLDRQQREYFINQEIHNLQAELGNKDESTVKSEDIEQLKKTAEQKQWNDKARETFEKELSKLSRTNTQSPDYNVQLNYLQTLVDLPWDYCTESDIKIPAAERILNHDHYGMERVKERILEHLAVLKLRSDHKSPIICLYGPPGVGKTSLGRSIAKALKRKYVRISLGGVHDESEIRGHRRTYVGAMPGRIIKGLLKAGSSNPVYILDEIDKISQNNINGDPSSAMLEVLDPEQNNAFHDNYLDLDYDLSRVMFIATANDINSIPRPLLDRMELIEVSGYITEEKIEIARRHLIPKKIEENGLGECGKNIKFSKPAIEFIIERYTRESGVRSLEKQIDKLFRKIALRFAREDAKENFNITPREVEEMLGKPTFSRDKYQGNEYAGVVTGLAWTSVGGEILFIETSLSRGKGGKLTLTGNLGDVMKESAMLALEYIKSHADRLGLDMRIFENYNIHIHVPEGAVPKDGPSAGITMATSIASALTQRKVRAGVAMTGEITLRGKVLPVGGIKEKILAAKRAGITDLMLCEENRKDIDEIPATYLKGLHFHYVETILDVWDFALTDEKVKNPMQFVFDEKKEFDA